MKYPCNIQKEKQKKINISHSNRGMSLEKDINLSNEYYLEKNIAIIHKKPTPIKIVKVIFDKLKKPIIKEAFFEKPSTTDYNGIFKGNYIDFEAKEVKEKKYFCLNNIHKHQLNHLIKIDEHKGISFLIVRFTKYNKTFLLESKFIKEVETNSINIDFFEKHGFIIEEKYNPRLDYIKVVDKILEENYEKI